MTQEHCVGKQERDAMKRCIIAVLTALMIGLNAAGQEPVQNIFKDIPYNDGQLGKRQLLDEKHLLVMQAALKPGQKVPQHNANSNVHLLIVEGQVVATLNGKDTIANPGDILPVAFKTLMSVRNDSKNNASFLIIKTPNPSEMEP
jgi:quercetin dioxygenase-like cupin family protein